MKRVIFGATASPYILAAVLRHHFKVTSKSEEFLQILNKNFYVDDFIVSLNTENDCLETAEEVTEIIQKMNGELGKWNSNCSTFSQSDDADEKSEVKVLGIMWKKVNDIIQIRSSATEEILSTKRKLLQKLASLFDPLGLITPYVMMGKLLLQETWMIGIGWDIEFDDSSLMST